MSLLGLLLAPFTAVVRHFRRLDLSRGSIDMTDARTLWEHAEQLREEMAARISTLEAQVAALTTGADNLRDLLTAALLREGDLRHDVAVLTERLRHFEQAPAP